MRTSLLLTVPLVLSSCGSGGGGGPGPVSVSWTPASATVGEGDTRALELRLALTIPALTTDLTVSVDDAGTGGATAGLDYTLGATTVVFPAGSLDGATRSVTLEALADGVFEGQEESVELVLSLPAGGATLGARRLAVELAERDVLELEFLAPALVVHEDNAPAHAIQVRASSPTGSSLGKALELSLTDERAGSASAGVDYRLPSQVVRLEPGPLGRVVTFTLEVLADALSEGDETLSLRMEPDLPGVFVPASVLAVQLADPPVQSEPLLLVRAAGVGLTPGSELEFAAGEALELELVNRGQDTLHLGFPLLDGDTRDYRVELLGFEPALRDVADIAPTLASAGELDALRAGGPRVDLSGVGLAGGERVTLELERRPSPLTPGAVLALDDARRPLRAHGFHYGGRVAGEPETAVLLAVGEGAGAHGWIQRRGETQALVLAPGLAPLARRVPRGSERALAPLCASPVAGPAQPQRLGVPPADPLPTLRLALETDSAFFQIFGSADAAEAYILELVAAAREIYRRELGLELELAYLGLYPGADPWLTPDGFGTTLELLEEFEQGWTDPPVEAELLHFLSAAPLGGGIARLLGYCGAHGAFGVTTGITGLFDPVTFADSQDLFVFAHEIGHGLGGVHTHEVCPPLDLCWTNCTNELECALGTLMSYCGLCGPVDPLRFRLHPWTADSIRHSAEFSCLPDTELAGGSALRLRVTFEPDELAPDPARRRHAHFTLRHDATNAGPTLAFDLTGEP